MAVQHACLVTREELKLALDLRESSRRNPQLDRAIQSATGDTNKLLNRVFFPVIATRIWDWPNYQRAYPWRIWLDANELADVTTNVPVVTSGGVVIPSNEVFWGPWNYSPPFTFLELNRATNAAFGGGPTPQRDVTITGTFGYWTQTTGAGSLAAAVTDTTSATVSVTDASQMGVGDVIIADTEHMIVADRKMASTGVSFSGLTTASAADQQLAVPDGTAFAIGEVLLLDTERCLIVDITGNYLVLQRGWDGTTLSAHTSGTIYADRQLTVIRGAHGTTAATHLINTALSRCLVPPPVKELAVAEAENSFLQETSGYSRTVGEGDNLRPISGAGLADVRARATASHGRKSRVRVV